MLILVFLQIKVFCGLYYKHVTMVNYASSSVNKLKASLIDDTSIVIYDHHMFIVQATAVCKLSCSIMSHLSVQAAFFFFSVHRLAMADRGS
jgi:hypothetical protein